MCIKDHKQVDSNVVTATAVNTKVTVSISPAPVRSRSTTSFSNVRHEPNEKPLQPKNELTLARWIEVTLGCLIFFPALPFLVCQIALCTAWEALDKRTFRLIELAAHVNEIASQNRFLQSLVKHPADTFVVPTTIWLGFLLPYYFYCELMHVKNMQQPLGQGDQEMWSLSSLDIPRACLYNIVRIGPMYMHFMYVYVLCHKEAHCFGKIFASPYHHVLQYTYNYYVGLFHGVLPGPFTLSHVYNHHKYDNGKDDVYSTGSFPRDSFVSFLRYVWIWFLYASNVSSVIQFYKENKPIMVFKSVASTLYFLVILSFICFYAGPVFTLVYLVYPFVEGNILLAMVNYTWHAFIDPNDFDNEYVNSTTILEGLNFTLSEEYHVVHHQYAGIHWSRHQEMYQKHFEEYKRNLATLFYKVNIFEVWGMCVFKQYDALAERFVQLETDPSKLLSKREIAQILKERLQCTTWSYGGDDDDDHSNTRDKTV